MKGKYHSHHIEAGIDEAGRGCLAGPVYAAAVILPEHFSHPVLRDSKQLTARQRLQLREEIQEKAIAWSVASIDHQRIDQINILHAAIEAMHHAIEKLPVQPGHLIIDGNRFKPYKDIPHQCIVKGDARYYSIAAASVLAKTYRDEHMVGLHQEYPNYAWDQNKGYATKKHRQAIIQYGISPFHRKSFNLTARQLKIPFEGKTNI